MVTKCSDIVALGVTVATQQFFSLRDDEPSGRPTPWARIIDRSWQIWTSSFFFTDKQTSSWWTSFEVIFFLPEAPACEHQGLLFTFAVRYDAAFLSMRTVRLVNNPRNITTITYLRLFVLIVMGSVWPADFVHKSAWTQASRPANYFFC